MSSGTRKSKATSKAPYEPSILRRARQKFHALTLDLFFREGQFWENVRGRRHRLQDALYHQRLNGWERKGGLFPNEDDGPQRCPGCLRCDPD